MKNDPPTTESNKSSSPATCGDVGVAEIKELAWALLDDRISEASLSRLEQMLNGSDAARKDYLDCIRLHTDLQDYFAGEKPASNRPSTPAKSPVLGFLNAGSLPIDIGSHTNNS